MGDQTSDRGCCHCTTAEEQNRIVMEQIPVLQKAAECGDTNALYGVLAQNPYILDQIDAIPFLHSPLHAAACNNQIGFAMEVAMLKPSLARKLNNEGYSPMHLGLQCGHIQVVRSLLTIDTQLVRVKGRDGFSLLHTAAQIDECGLVEEFLLSCPNSIDDLTSQCQTAVHVAVQNKSITTCKYLLRWLNLVSRVEVLRWKDAGGNTILHVAAFADNAEAMKLFIKHVSVNAKNLQDQTALDLVQDNGSGIRRILGRAGAKLGSNYCIVKPSSSRWRIKQREVAGDMRTGYDQLHTTELRNITLVVVTLIANATYQAVLSPPGGYWSNDSSLSPAPAPAPSAVAGDQIPMTHVAGQMIMTGFSQDIFVIANTIAFMLSIALILLLTAGTAASSFIILTALFLGLTYCSALLHNMDPQYPGINLLNFIFIGLVCFFPEALYRHLRSRRHENPLRRRWMSN